MFSVVEKNKLVRSYRLPGSTVPGGRARAGLQVALLHIRRLFQDITVVFVESLTIWPLTHHKASPPSSTAGLGALT